MAELLACFGDPAIFEISLAWFEDPEPMSTRPVEVGWSSGDMRIVVAGQVLTTHTWPAVPQDRVRWYLAPVFRWLAASWTWLLHEERFAWNDNQALAAAPAVSEALRRHFGAADRDDSPYPAIQSWWARHALRAADASALYPDLVVRRLEDDVELSWTRRPPVSAPDGFAFALTPGVAVVPVNAVAEPLWEALAWFLATAPMRAGYDARLVAQVDAAVTGLDLLPTAALEAGYLPSETVKPPRGRAADGPPSGAQHPYADSSRTRPHG